MSIDPAPYIWSSYVLGFVSVFGIYVWLVVQNKKLKQLKSIIEKETKS